MKEPRGEGRQQRDTKPVLDHLNQSQKACPLESFGAPALGETADRERMFEAMAFCQQQQIFARSALRLDVRLRGQGMGRAEHDDERILKQDHALDCATFIGQREQHDVKLALVQSVKQTISQVFRPPIEHTGPGSGATLLGRKFTVQYVYL